MTKPDLLQASTSQQEQQLQSILRSSERRLSEQTERQLANARQAALAGQAAPQAFFVWPKLAAAVATIAVVAALMIPMFDNGSVKEYPDEKVFAQDDELFQDLEFYQWLVDTNAMADNG